MNLKALYRRYALFRVNHLYAGLPNYQHKRKLLNRAGFSIGEGTRIAGPFYCSAELTIGKNCWIGKNFCGNGNGKVEIGDNCDIGPEVVFQTGDHEIGDANQRAGRGLRRTQKVGDGTWIGGRTTVIGDTTIGNGCVIAGCSCVIHDVPDNTLAAGVPAEKKKSLAT